MAVLQGNAKQRSVRSFYPKNINGSLRFNDDDSAYLSYETGDSTTTTTQATLSAWVKRSEISSNGCIFGHNVSNSLRSAIYINDDDDFLYFQNGSNILKTNRKFRDPSAWYHFVITWDLTQSTASNRVKLYINGVQETSFSAESYPAQNATNSVPNFGQITLGANIYNNAPDLYLDGYLAEVHFTDGTAYDADAFGEFKNGVWVAKTPEVTYGTNGFYLDFQDDTEVEAFNTVLWTSEGGDPATVSITGMGFQPDLVWVKNRSSAQSHLLYDSVRGAGAEKELISDLTYYEGQGNAESYGYLSSFDSDGFTFSRGNSGWINANQSGTFKYVAWGWKAGDSNVSNTDGSITSTVRANDTYGFSIVKYTSTSGTVGHGLSTAPDFIIMKPTNNTDQWTVGHKELNGGSTPWDYGLPLNTTSTLQNNAGFWNDTAPTSTVVNRGTWNNGFEMIMYCWAEKTGYSKFGSYTGNGSTDWP